MFKKVWKKINYWMTRYNAWLTTDPIIWAVMKEKNKQGKMCHLVPEWKNDIDSTKKPKAE